MTLRRLRDPLGGGSAGDRRPLRNPQPRLVPFPSS